MELKLCYKTYDFKMSLGAMKQFKERTGKDLWYTIFSIHNVFVSTGGADTLNRLTSLYHACDFHTAAEAFHAMIKQCDKSVSLDEICDGMFKVGWVPNDEESDMAHPWPLLMVDVAKKVDEQFKESLEQTKKKADSKV